MPSPADEKLADFWLPGGVRPDGTAEIVVELPGTEQVHVATVTAAQLETFEEKIVVPDWAAQAYREDLDAARERAKRPPRRPADLERRSAGHRADAFIRELAADAAHASNSKLDAGRLRRAAAHDRRRAAICDQRRHRARTALADPRPVTRSRTSHRQRALARSSSRTGDSGDGDGGGGAGDGGEHPHVALSGCGR